MRTIRLLNTRPGARIFPIGLAFCICAITVTGFAQDEEKVSHQLQGIKDQIDEKDKAIESRKKELNQDPSLLKLMEDFQNAKSAADAFYAGSNDKYKEKTAELTQAQAQQKSLDAAANSALDALRAARAALCLKDPALMELYAARADLNSKYHLMILKSRMDGIFRKLGCAETLSDKTPLGEAKACLDMIYDGRKGSGGDMNDLFRESGPSQTGTPFFKTVHTNSGAVLLLVDGPVLNPERSDAKAAFWKKYLAEHPDDQSHAYEAEKKWEEEYDRVHASSATALPPRPPDPPGGGGGPLTVGASHYIDVPSPVLPSKPPSAMDIFSDKVREMLQMLRKAVEPIRERIIADVIAVRG